MQYRGSKANCHKYKGWKSFYVLGWYLYWLCWWIKMFHQQFKIIIELHVVTNFKIWFWISGSAIIFLLFYSNACSVVMFGFMLTIHETNANFFVLLKNNLYFFIFLLLHFNHGNTLILVTYGSVNQAKLLL